MSERKARGDDLTQLDAAALTGLYGRGTVSPREVVAATLDRIGRLNPTLNAYIWLDAEGAMRAADESGARWRRGEPASAVDGVPFGAKDMLQARGRPTLYGSRALPAGGDAASDAPAVARLKEAGAVFLGKTTTSEFGWKPTADSPLNGIVRNALNPALTSGGSSGGGAAAAAGLGPLQLGTDGAGSVRIPAAFNGVVALKATFGRVPASPAGPMLTLSHTGPIGRTVGDVARMLNVIARPDPRDWYALPAPTTDFLDGLDAGVAGMRLGLYLGGDALAVEPEIAEGVRALARRLEDAGAVIEEIALPLKEADEIFRIHWLAGACYLVSRLPAERRGLVDPGLLAVAEQGAGLDAQTYYRATVARQHLGEKLQSLMGRFDAILTPTTPILPFAAGREWPAERACASWLDWAPLTFLFNLTRQPAASVPAATTPAGLSVGVQVAGPLYGEALVLRVARAIERVSAAGARTAPHGP
jgi:aspartyl-tRNA(Asn)/glutamyl-tRNA(Gln) amidotransferase subunit A